MTEKPLIPTRVAYAEFDDHYFMGHKVFAELMPDSSLAELINMALGGAQLDPHKLHMLNSLGVVLTVADPRIWPLKVTRLGACYGSGLAGLASAMHVMDNRFASTWHISKHLAQQFMQLRKQLEKTQAIADFSAQDLFAALAELTRDLIDNSPIIPGFGVPARPIDERTVALQQKVNELGLQHGAYWSIFLTLEKIVAQRRKLPANIVTAWTAQALDLGFAPNQIGPLSIAVGFHTFLAQAFEEQKQKNVSMQCLPNAFIDYQGPAQRRSPRAKAADKSASDDHKTPA